MLWLIKNIFGMTGLYAAVKNAAIPRLAEFGYRGIRKEYGGIQYTIELHHCEITFWHYKMDLGCSIRPISTDPEIEYSSRQIAEEMISKGSERYAVERQTHMILHDYGHLLRGDFTDWPIDSPNH